MNFLAGVQRLHSETMVSTAAPTSVVGASDRNARLFNWYADAWMELQSEREWRWMRATTDAVLTVGQQTYGPADLGITRFGRWRLDDDDYSPTIYVAGSPNTTWGVNHCPLDLFRLRWIYRTQGASTPIEWTFDESDQMLLGPAPAVAYKLRAEYWKEPFALVDDTDEPDLPDRFALLPMWRALQEAAKANASPEILNRAEKNYSDLHNKLVRDQGRLAYL